MEGNILKEIMAVLRCFIFSSLRVILFYQINCELTLHYNLYQIFCPWLRRDPDQMSLQRSKEISDSLYQILSQWPALKYMILNFLQANYNIDDIINDMLVMYQAWWLCYIIFSKLPLNRGGNCLFCSV